MSAPNSNVRYVEPNMTNHGWQHEDDFERTPRLEDYCIAMNIEVEVSSRDSQGSIKDGDKEVLVLQWNNSTTSKVSFMSGTRIGGYNYNGTERTPKLSGTSQNLTTYYADMYVGDLINYGTTEMIGIKSVNIEYAKSCVPIITVQFTDVRGLSLFQPTELSRNNTYDGIKGLNKDNVAQSFFQCFFKMPLPKFTIYIKGFYGNPVAYVCMCDKFDTNFNSESGDFDITARFIGYSYSFMTDVSFDALLAAPYSDFFGKKYWDDQVKGGRFTIKDKLKTRDMPMPTLYEIHSDFKRLIQTSDSAMQETTLTEEEKTHEKEITALKEIRGKYQQWYDQLFTLLKTKYGKRYCFDFKEDIESDADWYRILILTNSSTSTVHDLREDYVQYDTAFKETNNSLYAAIEEFNASGYSYKKLKNISKDFSEYTRIKLFKDCYVNRNTRKIEFGGFDKENKLNRVQVVNRLFHTNVTSSETQGNSTVEINSDWIAKHGNTMKDYTLSTIYNDGIDQYKDAFLIEVDYSDIKRRINILNQDAKKSNEQKEKEKARKEHNRIMMSKMNWYPSIENFTRIMMAHLETFMMMMYNVAESCSSRTPKDLGITIGKDGDACDVNVNSGVVPPFPRVIKTEIGDDGIPKKVDSWVGSYDNGKGFIEADMINGLFNAVEYIQSLVKAEKAVEEATQNVESEKPKIIVKHPLTSYDFHLTKNPYGDETDIANDANAFAGKISMRMFDILSISNFKKQYNSKLNPSNGNFIKSIGAIEAENFFDKVKITSSNMLGLIGAKGDSGTITPQTIIDCVKTDIGIGGNEKLPWQSTKTDDGLFDDEFWLSRYSTSYSKTQKTRLYPLQNMSFASLDSSLKKFNKDANSIDINNNDVAVSWIETSGDNAMKLLSSKNDSMFGSVHISDNYKLVSNYLDEANSSPNNSYKDIYDLLYNDSVINLETFGEMINTNGVFRPKQGIITKTKTCIHKFNTNIDSLFVYANKETKELQCGSVSEGNKVEYSFDIEKLSDYTSSIENKNITSWFLTECRGFDKVSDTFKISRNKSLFVQSTNKKDMLSVEWGYGGSADKLDGFFLMGLEAIDYAAVAKHLNSDETFTYLPRLAVLQIGAALATVNGIKEVVSVESLSKKIMLPNSFDKIINYLNRISYTTRIAYIKYFKDWVFKHNSEINKNFVNTTMEVACLYEIDNEKRALFREDSEAVSTMSNNLMLPVLVTKSTVNHFRGVPKNGLKIDNNVATLYLDGFLGRLRELYGIGNEAKGGDAVKLAKEPNKTSEDMKKELYRYLKLVYDKWVPATDKDSWLFDTFFNDESIKGKNGCEGHLFHFIDSFYNRIGDKLLINPRLLSNKIDAALQANDVNTMMLGFMADIYSQNKCMLMCLQNFMDLSEDGGMETMFKPIPYNEMPMPHKHPDFVVVYPYEPSKYLNVDNGEFNNDSFMLNDEFDTPLPIRSRTVGDDKGYKIPAFGVSYGKQYQSYFKKVNVGMSNPIATQQSIMAKHAILRASQDTSTKSTVAQDMYDIYATQSYTCTVEMLGCAWVQPLMYFVLTNVPMFRGSYLIFKVTHKITQGSMTTTFLGTRMANVSNKLVEEIFTDEDFGSDTLPYLESGREKMADIENDCPYKVYPLFEETNNIEISGDAEKDGKAIMEQLIEIGYNEYAAAGIVGNMYIESYDYKGTGKHFKYDLVAKDSGTSGGLCMWHNGNLIDLVEGKTTNLGHNSTYITYSESVKKDYSERLRKLGLGAQLTYLKNTMTKDSKNWIPYQFETYNADSLAAKSASIAAQKFREKYERSANKTEQQKKVNQQRYDAADKFYKLYKNGSNTVKKSEPDKDVKKDIYQALFDAIQKSINSTNKACELKWNKNDSGVMEITQFNGNSTDKLPLVFDIILNGYYEYVQKLYWVTASEDFKSNPIRISIYPSQKPKPNERRIIVMADGKATSSASLRFGADDTSINQSLLKSVYKKYKGTDKEIPQFDDKDIFKNIEIKSCNSVGSDNGNYGGSPITDVKCNVKDGKIGDWNVQLAVDWLMQYSRLSYSDNKCRPGAPLVGNPPSCVGRCWGYIKRALAASHFETDGSRSAYQAVGFLERNGFKKIREGRVNGHQGSDYPDKCVGDITVFNKCAGHEHGHINMWCGTQWVSDFRQEGNWINGSANTTYTVWRYSGSGGHFTS